MQPRREIGRYLWPIPALEDLCGNVSVYQTRRGGGGISDPLAQ
jgi:hypothetical protein